MNLPQRRYTAEDTPPYPLNAGDTNWVSCYNNVHLLLPIFKWRDSSDGDDIAFCAEVENQGQHSDAYWQKTKSEFHCDVDSSICDVHIDLQQVLAISEISTYMWKRSKMACDSGEDSFALYIQEWRDYFCAIRSRILAPFVVDMIENKGYNEYDLMT